MQSSRQESPCKVRPESLCGNSLLRTGDRANVSPLSTEATPCCCDRLPIGPRVVLRCDQLRAEVHGPILISTSSSFPGFQVMSDRTVFDFLLIFYLVSILVGLFAIDGLSKFNRRLRKENRRRRLCDEEEYAALTNRGV